MEPRFPLEALLLFFGAMLVVNPDGFTSMAEGLADALHRDMQSAAPWRPVPRRDTSPAERIKLRIIAFALAMVAVQ